MNLKSLVFAVAYVGTAAGETPAQDLARRSRLQLDVGIERAAGSLHWSVGAGGGDPPYSVLTFHDLRFTQPYVATRYRVASRLSAHWFLDGTARVSVAFRGSVRDADYGDAGEIRRIVADAKGSSHGFQSVALTCSPYAAALPWSDALSLSLGWREQRQVMRIRDGIQVKPDTMEWALEGLDSRYVATWSGPWVGVESQIAKGRLLTTARIALQRTDYTAEGVWNLREQLAQDPSFAQTGRGWSMDAQVEFGYALLDWLSLSLDGRFARARVKEGDDVLFLADGRRAKAELVEAYSRQAAVRIGIQTAF